jgi:phosphatidylserine decarboxylase
VGVDEHVRRGQRIGMIKFGSRCELIVPRELVGQVRVAPGEYVRAGASVLVEIAPPA